VTGVNTWGPMRSGCPVGDRHALLAAIHTGDGLYRDSCNPTMVRTVVIRVCGMGNLPDWGGCGVVCHPRCWPTADITDIWDGKPPSPGLPITRPSVTGPLRHRASPSSGPLSPGFSITSTRTRPTPTYLALIDRPDPSPARPGRIGPRGIPSPAPHHVHRQTPPRHRRIHHHTPSNMKSRFGLRIVRRTTNRSVLESSRPLDGLTDHISSRLELEQGIPDLTLRATHATACSS
jgi:hypothetical protein